MGGFANNAPIVSDGLVFYVDAGNSKSYPGSGTTWTDLIGSADGTLTNGPTYSSANGGVLDFDGSNDKVLFSQSNFPTTYTKFAVFYADDTNTRNILSASSPSDSGHALYLKNGNINAGHRGQYTKVNSSISTGTWYTCAVTFDNSTTQIKLYLDGSLVSTSTALTLSAGGDYKIGEHSSNQSFNGKIPLVQIYNRVLSASEILQNHNALKNRFV